MSGGSKRSIQSANLSQPNSIISLAVLGLSGTDVEKGAVGVGKSVFCNRLVRPHYNDFYPEHVSYLSQADFNCSPVVNGDHWLYWGEVDLDRGDYAGPSSRIRVVEQTTFLNDETFEPHHSRISDYHIRALKSELESRGKIMYICRDQLGQESDFVFHELQQGNCHIDAFAILFDVSHVEGRSHQKQFVCVYSLISAALKTRKPVFLLASKCDKGDPAGILEFQKISQKKEFTKASNFYTAEISAFSNVNVADFLYLLAQTVDRQRNRLRIPPYLESEQMRNRRITMINAEFTELLHQLVPREEFPSQQGQLSWEILLTDFGVNCHPAYVAFVAESGARAASNQFDEHCRVLREWWLERELNERLPVLRDVLRRMFGRPYLCQTNWDQLKLELEAHPHFPTYFQPFGRSIDRYSKNIEADDRLPSELIQKPEARQLFQEYQKELLDEIALERQADKFRKLLELKDAVTPGRTFSDAKVMCQEIGEFEQVLPPENARWIYEDYQKEIKKKAQRDFNELLLENISLFVDLIVEWRTKQSQEPNRINCLSEREFNIISSALIEDKRYRDMSGLADKRRDLVSKLANFMSMPLTCFCLAGEKCADVVIGQMATDIRHESSFCTIDAEVFGEPTLISQLIFALKAVLPSDKLYHHNDRVVKINIYAANAPQAKNDRVRTPICLIDSAKTCHQLLDESKDLFASGPAPLFVLVPNRSNQEISYGLQRMGTQLADRFKGIFVGSELNDNEIRSSTLFENNQMEMVLHELCMGQMGTSYADLRVRMFFLCDDPLSIQQVLSPLIDQCVQTDDNGGCFCLDVTLPEGMNSRVAVHSGSYHHWMLSKWQLNAINGHVLIYCPMRAASWRHAETSIQLLLDAAAIAGPPSSNILERQIMAKSILLIAVDDPSCYFRDKDSSQLLTEGARLAEKVGCRFMAISSSMPQTAQFQFYNDFFAQLLHNQPLPNSTYTVCSQNPSLFVAKRRPTFLNHSTFTGSALTLLSAYSSTDSAAQNTTAQCSQIPSLNHEAVSPTPPLSARSADSQQAFSVNGATSVNSTNNTTLTADEMTNRLRRPLSAIGSLMSGSQSAENGSQSSHEEPCMDALSAEGFSRQLRFSPSKFRRLFQRNAGSESSTDEKSQSKKQLQRSSTVDADTTPEVVNASENNGFRSYIRVSDSQDHQRTRPRKPQKSRSVESVDDTEMIFTPRIEQVAQNDLKQMERGRPSRIRRFTHRCKELTKGARRRGHSMTPRISTPSSSTPNSPTDLSYSAECRNGDEIPTFIKACIQHIERVGGLNTEGLYRTSGNQSEASDLEQHFRRTGQFKSDADLSSAVTALKNYVNAFGDPLIPQRLHEEIINIFADRDDVYDNRPLETKSLDRLRRLFDRELPRVNARTLMFLCAHLCRVSDNQARNLMPTSNLALIWSASMFRPELTSVSKSASLLARFHVACYFCIKHYNILFSLPPLS